MKRKLWHSTLTAKEKRHLKEDAGCSLTSIEPFKRTIATQREGDCWECWSIAKKLGLLP